MLKPVIASGNISQMYEQFENVVFPNLKIQVTPLIDEMLRIATSPDSTIIGELLGSSIEGLSHLPNLEFHKILVTKIVLFH